MYMEIFRRGYNCVRHFTTLIFVAFGWLVQKIGGRPMSETATGASSPSELVSMAAPFNFAAFIKVAWLVLKLTHFACK